MKNIFALFMSVIFVGAVFAQAATPNVVTTNAQGQQQEVLIKVQQMAPEAPKTSLVVKANEWVDFGKNVGTAMDAGLSSLTENANKFAKTDAGKFTMGVIAWKVAGREAVELTNRAVRIVVGIPVLIAVNFLFIWFYRRNFLARKELVEREGPWYARTKVKWEIVNDESFGEGKSAAAVITGAAWLIFNGVMIANII